MGILQAPGTFGFDHTKYRPPRTDAESIPMDEFGRPADQDAEEHAHRSNAFQTTTNPHNETLLPVQNRPRPSSPVPFSHYAITNEKTVSLVPNGKPPVDIRNPNDDDNGAGCCKCVIM